MLQIFREIETSGEELIITDRNVPVLKITPIRQKQSVEELFGSLDGQIIFLEDPDLPTIDEWELV
jgi:antitoxin (DNA-binding transcriptional repressor) of toxin-antitoxin stability system